MGVQQYVIAFNTEEELAKIVAIVKHHNHTYMSSEFVRYSKHTDFKQLQGGEELENLYTLALKPGKAYKDVARGPTLSRVLLAVHGGGRGSTFHYLAWHLQREFGRTGIAVYGYESGMQGRLDDASQRRVDPSLYKAPAFHFAHEARKVTPAVYTTLVLGENPAFRTWKESLGERLTNQALKKRKRDDPSVPDPHVYTYESHEDGYVVEDKVFAAGERAAAEQHVAKLQEEDQRAKEEAEARNARTLERYKAHRADDKRYYRFQGKGSFWLTAAQLAERVVLPDYSGHEDAKVTVDCEALDLAYGRKTVDEVDAMLAAGHKVWLSTC